MAKVRKLGVWLDGTRVADLEQRRWPEIRCRYSAEALERWPSNSPLLSCSLPLGRRPQDALPFCNGLLPEGQALQAMAAEAGVAVNDSFELLERFGRDVAGALVIGGDGRVPPGFGVQPYSEESLAAAVAALDERATHILKADDARYPGLVAAEHLCLELARAVGLTTVRSELTELAGVQCLVVSRYDRETVDGKVRRIHQEDLCQALGIDPDGARGRAKYERAGGPSLRQAAELLDTYAADAPAQLDRLLAVIAFTVLIGNADAHGKNLSLLHPTAETVELAPLYDTVPTALWPRLRKEAAMSIGGQVTLADVTVEDIVREAVSWSHPRERARRAVAAAVAAVVGALDAEAIPPDSEVARYVRARAEGLR